MIIIAQNFVLARNDNKNSQTFFTIKGNEKKIMHLIKEKIQGYR